MTPTWFFLVVVAFGVFANGPRAIQAQLLFCLFGATAAAELTALGGAPVLPAVAFLPFFLSRAWAERAPSLRRMPRAGVWLIVTVAWAVFSALVLPRLLEGSVAIKTFDRGGRDGAVTVLLRPVSGNITQSAYAVIDVLVFFAMRVMLVRRDRMDTFARGVLLLAAVNCFAGVFGLAEYYAGLPRILEAVRNAKYTVYDTYELGGIARVQGTFPEASMFAMFTLPLFAFTSSLWFTRAYSPYAGWLTALSLALLLISTSGTAYVGLAVYFGIVGLGLAARLFTRGVVPRAESLLVASALAVIAVGVVLVSSPEPLKYVGQFLDTVLFRKMTSSSGVDRAAANWLAWTDFLQTYGLGVGLGSTRASSFALVLLSNLGVVGVLAFSLFLLSAFRSPEPDDSTTSVVARASRQAMIGGLIAASIAGNVFELGIAFYCFAAAATMTLRDVEPSAPRTALAARSERSLTFA
jgi:hypothetical protein